MEKRELVYPAGYDAKSQSVVRLFAAQFDDQLKLLKDAVKNLTVEQLEWQPHRGMNTIGMLLAHLGVVEVFWINVASKGISSEAEEDESVLKAIGIRSDDDGMPIKPGGLHPQTLSGKSVADYFVILDKARSSVHGELRNWMDADLENTFSRKRGNLERSYTRLWTLYHVLEHFAAHFGQILLIKHLMRDAGVLAAEGK